MKKLGQECLKDREIQGMRKENNTNREYVKGTKRIKERKKRNEV
jgi:hypothetical protein